jgi:hypothetical protein
MSTPVDTSFGRGRQRAGSGHTVGMSMEGRIFENTMRGVRQDSTWQAACGRPRSTPVRKERFFGRASERRTSGERRVDDARDHGSGLLLRQDGRTEVPGTPPAGPRVGLEPAPSGAGTRHLLSGCSPGSTASSDIAFQDTALLGWHDRPAISGFRRGRPCTLTDGPLGDRRVGEVTTESTQEAKARRGRPTAGTPPVAPRVEP